jgi:hypothetical protein
MIYKEEAITDIVIAMMGALCLQFGFDNEGLLAKSALIWGGMCFGYLVTVYLNGEAE